MYRIDNNWHICMLTELMTWYFIGGFELFSLVILSMILAVHGESLTNSITHMYGHRKYQCQFHSNCDV